MSTTLYELHLIYKNVTRSSDVLGESSPWKMSKPTVVQKY